MKTLREKLVLSREEVGVFGNLRSRRVFMDGTALGRRSGRAGGFIIIPIRERSTFVYLLWSYF